ALCRRLEVDNSGRTFHGALLDAELLAEVYVRLTRGQHSLLADDSHSSGNEMVDDDLGPFDFGALLLPVVEPNATERQAHQAALTGLDKDAGGACLWRRLEGPQAVA
ncbi:MAG: DNA polymerase III subunit epsilon, partial [Inhella sp.]